ncbi:unnamed protein product [Lactuca virosa]|uniref:Uncharacterized protein n=1 Tax=Lactuca virosa TaxID=75947 RepID=A0AAU9M4P0_9ASTR|nr:unnamed protein product [Lactuca virosa]
MCFSRVGPFSDVNESIKLTGWTVLLFSPFNHRHQFFRHRSLSLSLCSSYELPSSIAIYRLYCFLSKDQ